MRYDLVARVICLSFVLVIGVAGTLLAGTPFVPNDPYFNTGNPTGFPGQWYLDKQTSGAAIDVNIRGAWNRGVTGQGVAIGIIDDGLDNTDSYSKHPDLDPNELRSLGWDFFWNEPWPSDGSVGYHGIGVGGIAAARGGNGKGITGAAPYANLVNLFHGGNYIPSKSYRSSYDGATASAIVYRPDAIKIKNCSWGWPEALVPLPETEAAIQSTAGSGTINVFCAHNWRAGYGGWGVASSDTNRMSCTHLPGEIVVSGVGMNGTYASFSNYGASVTVTAPGVNMLTTDAVGGDGYNGGGLYFPDNDYIPSSGTSLAAPLVSGSLALAKQVQPKLDVRFAKHLLAKTSSIVDATDATTMGGWSTNAAGYHFNNNYGFGLINADALTREAVKYTGITPAVVNTTNTVSVGTTIPSNNTTGVTRSLAVGYTGALEEVEVTLNMGAFLTNDIEAILTSPSGTHSMVLCPNGAGDQTTAASSWTVTSNAFWGESPTGTWQLQLLDTTGGYDTTALLWNSFSLAFHTGSLIAAHPGDANGDNGVDINDLSKVLTNYNLTGLTWSDGDFTSDGTVDISDLSIVLTNYNTSYTAPSGNIRAVPEPSTIALLLASAIGLFAWRRRK
jgi:subtilisin-like proprotein convertase family protein